MRPSATLPSDISAYDRSFFGHPRGLSTLFFAEMWERFSFYGMKAILILFMTLATIEGGLGFDRIKAGMIISIYTAMVYLSNWPGGWIADRILGPRVSIFIGGVIIMFGHISLAFHGLGFFYLGLALIICGTGLLKPNMSSMVGQLYTEKDNRRDAGFSLYYMGINLGAFIAPLVCGFLAQDVRFRHQLEIWGIDPKDSWHFGFAAAAVGMFFGLVQYVWGRRFLGNVGMRPTPSENPEADARLKWRFLMVIAGIMVLGALLAIAHSTGVFEISIEKINALLGGVLVLAPILYFGYVLIFANFTIIEKKRLAVVGLLFVFSALFFAAFEQGGNTMNLFADQNTRNSIFGWEFPSSYFQSVNPVMIIAFAPIFAWLWLRLGPREPSSPAKFAIALLIIGTSFGVLTYAAWLSGPDKIRVSPFWLTFAFLLNTFAELCISPIGLSMVTKLAPRTVANQLMGVWFMANALANYLAGKSVELTGKLDTRTIAGYTLTPDAQNFALVAVVSLTAALILAVLIYPITRMMGGVK